MNIDLTGLTVADYRIELSMANGRVPSNISVYPSSKALAEKLKSALKSADVGFYTAISMAVCPFAHHIPADALSERIATSMEAAGHSVERVYFEPTSITPVPIQSFILL